MEGCPIEAIWMRRLISSGDQPPIGEPNAGNRPVRFGRRGDLIGRPYPYLRVLFQEKRHRSHSRTIKSFHLRQALDLLGNFVIPEMSAQKVCKGERKTCYVEMEVAN
jgi:hypothetical protein